MSLRVFYFVILSVLATTALLSLAWEFWLEDLIPPEVGAGDDIEDTAERWEFFVTTMVFATIALIGPTIVGVRIIRRDQALQAEIRRLSQEDHLTGLLNRRRINQLLDDEIGRARRYATGFSIILMDVDHFKAVNDRFGHQAGDAVLKTIAEVIRSGVRGSDLVGRWGGEEFMILSPQTDLAGAIALAEKMRARLEAEGWDRIDAITASFGVASFDREDDAEALIARADAGLYAAKQGGRNRVEAVARRPAADAGRGRHVRAPR